MKGTNVFMSDPLETLFSHKPRVGEEQTVSLFDYVKPLAKSV